MILRYALRSVCFSVAFLVSFGGLALADTGAATLTAAQQARRSVERAQAAKLAQSVPTALLGAYFSIANGEKSTVLLLNKILDPIQVSIDVFSPSGDRFPIGHFILEPSRHLELSLADLLASVEGSPDEGSVAVNYTGDDSLQGWLVLQRGKDFIELPLHPEEDIVGQDWVSYWNSSPTDADPVYVVANMGVASAEFLLRVGGTGNRREERHVAIHAGEQWIFSPRIGRSPLVSGWVELIPVQGSEKLVLSAFLRGRNTLAALPPGGSSRPVVSRSFDAVRIPSGIALPSLTKTEVVLFNPSEDVIEAKIDWIAAQSGSVLSTRTLRVGSHEVDSLSLLTPNSFRRDALRLHVEASTPFAIHGFTRLGGGAVVDLGLSATGAGHATGSYPILDPTRYEAFSTIVNLGAEMARVVGQVHWDGGTYSIGPIEIPAGASRRIDFSELAAVGEPDLRGRRLDPRHRDAMFRWLSQGPSRHLIARTEAKPRGSDDSFGFNCLSCCFQSPFGGIEPPLVEFALGQSASFQTSVGYETCDGPMGPFPVEPVSVSVPSPFTWDGSVISASTAANDDFVFSGGVFEGLTEMCRDFFTFIVGEGRAEMCQKTHNPLDFDEGRTCSSQATICSVCQGCCNGIFNMRVCDGKNIEIASQEKNACIGVCIVDRC